MANPLPPDYDVASTLQAILAKRRDEQRQRMIDQLNEDNTRNQMANRDLETQSMAGYRTKLGAQAEEATRTSQVGKIGRGTSESDITNEEVRKYIEGLGGFGSSPQAATDVSAKIGFPEADMAAKAAEQGGTPPAIFGADSKPTAPAQPTAPASRSYLGTPAEQEAEANRTMLLKMASDPKLGQDPLRASLLMKAFGGVDQVSSEHIDQRDKTVTPVTPQGKALSQINLGPRGTALELNHPPVGYSGGAAAFKQDIYQIPDPNNPGAVISVWGKPGQQFTTENQVTFNGQPVDGTVRKGNQPASFSRIPVGIAQNLAKLRQAAESTGNPEDVAAYNQAQSVAISQAVGVTPRVRDTVRAVMTDPNAGSYTTREIIEHQASQWQGSPEELQQFVGLITEVRGM